MRSNSLRAGAALEEQPGGLQIKGGDTVQEPVLVSALPLELARDEDFVTKGGTQHVESLAVRREAPLADPSWLTATSGGQIDLLNQPLLSKESTAPWHLGWKLIT